MKISNRGKSAPTYTSQVEQAVTLVESGDWDLAAKICLPIWHRRRYGDDDPFMLRDEPDSPHRIADEDEIPWEVPYIIGTAHLQGGEPDAAEFYFDWLSRAIPSLAEGLYMLGRVAVVRNDDWTAAQLFRRLLTKYPAHADGHRQLAESLLRLDQKQDALVHFRHALALQPSDGELIERVDEIEKQLGIRDVVVIPGQSTCRDAKTAVFISNYLGWREARLATALKSRGWKVVLLFRNDPIYHPSEYFDEYQHHKTPWEAVAYAQRYNASIYHVFCHQNYDTPTALMLNGIGPIIIDCKDQLEGMFHQHYFEDQPTRMEQIRLEQFALENADGICSRSLMPQIAKPAFEISAPTLFYPEFCWNEKDAEYSKKLSARDGDLHVVYAGTMLLKTEDGEYAVESYRWLAEILVANKIHYHIYPINGAGELHELRNDFAELERETPYFHFHEPVFGSEWLAELSQYDAGVAFCFPDEKGATRNIVTTAGASRWYAGKVADYLDVGAVLWTSADCLVGWLAERYGFGEAIDWKDANSSEFWQSFEKRVKDGAFNLPMAREKWSIAEHAPRLEEFYNRVISLSDARVVPPAMTETA